MCNIPPDLIICPFFNCSKSELSLTNAINIGITHQLLQKAVGKPGTLVDSIEVSVNMAMISSDSAIPDSLLHFYKYNSIPIEIATTTR